MDLPVSLAFIAVGAVALYFGSRWLVDGAAALALRYGVSPLLIGLTVIAIGTSAPEAILALLTSLEGTNQLSLGNVLGANISNAALIFGVACLLYPMAMKLSRIWREAAFLLAAAPLLMLLSLDGHLDAVDGAILMVGLFSFLYMLYRTTKRGTCCAVVEEETELVEEIRVRSPRHIVLLITTGLILLSLGAQAVIEGASSTALALGVEREIIGLTVVALGTTIPELSVTITAARKGQSEVILGNIIGTNVVNTMFVLGIGSLVAGFDMSEAATWAGMAFMALFSTLLVVLLARLDRAEKKTGALVLSLYALYLAVIVLLFG